MKNTLILSALTAFSTFSLQAEGFAQSFTTTLTRTISGGYTPKMYSRSVKCEISPAGLQTTTFVGYAVTLVSTTPATNFDQERINNLIQVASQTTVTFVGPAPYDIPSTEYRAQNSDGKSIQLKGITYQNGPEFVENQSSEASALIFILDTLCGSL